LKKIAVVILNWNGAKLLQEFLPSVIKYSPEGTIYVIDNASSDDSLIVLREKFPSINIIQNKENFGFSQGYNEGLKNIEEEIYCLVNSDIEVTENWLTPILSLFERQPNTAIIQPKILDYKNKTHFEYAGAAGGFIDKFGYPYCRGRIFDTIEEDKGQYNDTRPVFWASGACFFIRKNVFRELKGFDTDFFAHQEEIDLCWRSFNLNYDTLYCGQSTVYHLGGATLSNSNPIKTYLNFRNSLLMLVKNLPTKTLLFILFGRLILDGIAGIQMLLKGKITHVIALIKSHFSFYLLFFKTIKKRKSICKVHYFYKTSIVYDYFIKNSTIFADKN
jgi:GT2 family glycosyltransferase